MKKNFYLSMRISCAKQEAIKPKPKQNVLQKTEQSENKTNINSYAQNVYYKDCFINKNFKTSFKGTSACDFDNSKEPPKTEEEFLNSLKLSNKYSVDEIEKILQMTEKVKDFEEIEDEVLYEMYEALAQSDINSDVKTLQNITDYICDILGDEDNEVDMNSVFLGITAVSQNLNANDYRFKDILQINSLGGFLGCDNLDLVKKFCRNIKNSIKNADSDYFYELLHNYSSSIQCEDSQLEKTNSQLEMLSQNYRDKDLLDVLLYLEKNDTSDTSDILKKLRMAENVYNELDVNLPDLKFFRDVFNQPINILAEKGYSEKQIADFLSTENYCNKILEIEGIKNANPKFMADFIEKIPNNTGIYDIVQRYTKGSSIFNNILSNTNGDLSKVDRNEKFTTGGGYIYTGAEALYYVNQMDRIMKNNEIQDDVTIYRGGGIAVLNQKTIDGKMLGDELKNALVNKDSQRLEEIEKILIGSDIKESHFMSTALTESSAKYFIEKETPVLWKINAPKGSNAIFADPFNTEHGVENELLFDRNSVLSVKDAKMEGNTFVITCDLSQNKCQKD